MGMVIPLPTKKKETSSEDHLEFAIRKLKKAYEIMGMDWDEARKEDPLDRARACFSELGELAAGTEPQEDLSRANVIPLQTSEKAKRRLNQSHYDAAMARCAAALERAEARLPSHLRTGSGHERQAAVKVANAKLVRFPTSESALRRLNQSQYDAAMSRVEAALEFVEDQLGPDATSQEQLQGDLTTRYALTALGNQRLDECNESTQQPPRATHQPGRGAPRRI